MPPYVNAVAGHPDPATISVQPGDVVMLDAVRTERPVVAVRVASVDLDGTDLDVTIDRVTLVRPAGLTPEELARELIDEAYEIAERALYRASNEALPPDATDAAKEAAYLQRKADGVDDPPPPDRASIAAAGGGPPIVPPGGPPGRG